MSAFSVRPLRRRLFAHAVAAVLSLALLPALQKPAAAAEADTARLKDGGKGADWAAWGATYGEQHFSPLTQINDKTVSRLGLAWAMDLPPGNSVSQPLAVDGVVYFVTFYGLVHAVDAKTGKELWVYDSKTTEVAGTKLRFSWGNRGIAWWAGKIYLGATDGRLIAIDAKTGKPVWTEQTLAPDDTNYITGAPRVLDGKVIIGFGGADVGPARGYVSTYDAETGKLLWRFHTVPGNPASGFENKTMEMAAKTWSGQWWRDGGGGTVWNAMSYDPDTKTVFIGVGNGTPWNHKVRSDGKGDNLFLASVVALNANTGEYKWHYQVNPGETWDFTATNDMAFADLRIGGKTRKVLMTAPKNGFFYVLDRVTGELISAEPFAKVNWASKIDLKTGRPVENPEARFEAGKIFTMWPSDRGAHNWWPMAFSSKTGLAYIPVLEKVATWMDFGLENEAWRKLMPVTTAQAASYIDLYPKTDDPIDGSTRLVAWDPRTQKAVWQQPTVGTINGGVMATAGNLVFQGQLDGRFVAYAADSGKPVWTFQANAPVLAPPISYSAGGQQYVTVLTGAGTGSAFIGPPLAPFKIEYRTMARRVLTFMLDGKAALPAPVVSRLKPIDDANFTPDKALVEQGAIVYAQRCSLCHGLDAVASGAAPELRASPITLSAEIFTNVVRVGVLVPVGMPRFEELTDAEVDGLRQYLRVRVQAWQTELAQGTTSPAR